MDIVSNRERFTINVRRDNFVNNNVVEAFFGKLFLQRLKNNLRMIIVNKSRLPK